MSVPSPKSGAKRSPQRTEVVRNPKTGKPVVNPKTGKPLRTVVK